MHLRVDLLGPLQLTVGGRSLAPGGPKLRGIIAMLALAGGRVVSVDDLLYGVWGEDLTDNARNTLQYHVSTFRKRLNEAGAGDALVNRDPGYSLQCATDVADFSRAARGISEPTGAAAEQSSADLTEALNLWRGVALADLREFEFAEARAVALEGQRLACLEAWADAELACGRADALVPALQDLVTEHPTRERLWEQLMLALYRTGRQDAALAAYQSARHALDRELGVAPSARLEQLQVAILSHDPALTPAGAAPAGQARPGRPMTQTILVRSEVVGAPTLVGPSGQRLELGGDPVLIGRSEECAMVLSDSQASRQHARVSRTAAGYVVEDLGSTNGTSLNGVRIDAPAPLQSNDRIEIGSSVIRFSALG